MVKSAYLDKNGVKKGAWSKEEDAKLREYILRYGHWNWRLLPKFAGLERCGKSCRLRWMNYLKPGVRRGNYTKEERDLIDKLHHQLGNKWSAIAAKLPGRSDNDIKNYWHTHFRKREKAKSGQSSRETQSSRTDRREIPANAFSGGAAPRSMSRELGNSGVSSDVFILESSISNLASPEASAAVESDLDSPEDKISALSITSGETDDVLYGLDGSFWNQPFMVDTYSNGNSSSLLDEFHVLSYML